VNAADDREPAKNAPAVAVARSGIPMRMEPSVIEMAPGLPLSLQALFAGRLKYRDGTGASSD